MLSFSLDLAVLITMRYTQASAYFASLYKLANRAIFTGLSCTNYFVIEMQTGENEEFNSHFS
jgi:hypothetical protein